MTPKISMKFMLTYKTSVRKICCHSSLAGVWCKFLPLAVRTCDWCRCECTLTSAKTTAWHFRSYPSLPCSHYLLPERNIFASIYRRKRQNDNCVTVSSTLYNHVEKSNSANQKIKFYINITADEYS